MLPAARRSAFLGAAGAPRAGSRRSAAARGSAVRVSALFGLGGPRTVSVPVNLYLALRVTTRAPAGAIDVAAAERATPADTTAEALSDAALTARGALLALAGRTLAAAPSRASYDAALAAGTADVEVPLESLPGALALLQARPSCRCQRAAGFAAALRPPAAPLPRLALTRRPRRARRRPATRQLRCGWAQPRCRRVADASRLRRCENNLSSAPSHAQGRSCGAAWRRDVCAAMALCHAALAADALERPTPDVIGGYQALEHAAALLRASRSAPALAARVAAALEEQAPDFALEALAAPLAARATRAAGRRVLRQLLWARDAATGALSPRLRDREAFMAAAAPLLTAVESAALILEAPRHVPRTPAAAAAAGVALLAGGFAARAPRTVRAAARALAAVPPPPRRRRAEADAVDGPEAAAAAEIAAAALADEVAVARAVAAMLLGDTEGAAAILRLDAPEAAGSPAGVAAFVGSHAGRLAGLVALAEAWLADVALPRHRDTSAAPRTLAAWFDAPPVVTGLAAFERPQPLRALGEAAAAAAERRAAAADDAAGAAPDYESGVSSAAASGPGTALGPPRAAGRGGLGAMGGAAVTLLVLLAGAALASRAGVGRPAAAAAQRVTVAAVAAAGATAESIAEAATAAMRRGAAAPMDAQLAGAVVRRWQTVKAAALGGRHDVAALDTILEARPR